MQVWVPKENQIKTNQLAKYNLFDSTFWNLYWAEKDEDKKREILYTFDNPEIEKGNEDEERRLEAVNEGDIGGV